jgi:hypothetical protein
VENSKVREKQPFPTPVWSQGHRTLLHPTGRPLTDCSWLLSGRLGKVGSSLKWTTTLLCGQQLGRWQPAVSCPAVVCGERASSPYGLLPDGGLHAVVCSAAAAARVELPDMDSDPDSLGGGPGGSSDHGGLSGLTDAVRLPAMSKSYLGIDAAWAGALQDAFLTSAFKFCKQAAWVQDPRQSNGLPLQIACPSSRSCFRSAAKAVARRNPRIG